MRPGAFRALPAAVRSGLRALAGPVLPLPPPADLRRCPECRRDRIAVAGSELDDAGAGRLRLRCGECGAGWCSAAGPQEAREALALQARRRGALERELATWDDDAVARELAALLRPR